MPRYQITDSGLRWLEVVFIERFGHTCRLTRTPEGLRFQIADRQGAIVFDKLGDGFVQAHSDHPCAWWDAASEDCYSVLGGELPAPGVAELSVPLIETRAGEHIIHYDIPGLIYWMLARVEEIDRTDLDNHERFPATSSHAYKHGYLERPVVDEWLHVLGQVIQRQWPGLELKQHKFQMRLSHDVDHPSRYAFLSVVGLARAMAGDILKRGDLKSALLAPWMRLRSQTALNPADPYNNFDWIMDVSERHGLKSAFYFICGRTAPQYDADYEPEHPAIRALMRRIHQRGHEIGLHPSYNTYQTPSAIITEGERLRAVAESEGIRQTEWGGRMHFLRWEHPTTLRAWDAAGIDYDSTLSYADRPGFRCGTCFEYPAFDPVAQQMLKLRIRPLVVMECTVMAPRYMGLGAGEVACTKFMQLKDACRAVEGCFTLLWHNSQFDSVAEKNLYQAVLG